MKHRQSRVFLYILSCMFCSISSMYLRGQNKIVEIDAVQNWQSVSRDAAISGDGKYVVYGVENNNGQQLLVVKAVNGSWKKEFSNCAANNAKFTQDDRSILFNAGKDSVAILSLGEENITYLPSIKMWDLVGTGSKEKLVYISNATGNSGELVVLNIKSKKQDSFNGIKQFEKNNSGNSLILHFEKDSRLDWFDVETNKAQTIIQGRVISNMKFDGSGRKIAYMIKENGLKPELWVYDSRSNQSTNLTNIIPPFHDQVLINSIDQFSGNDSSLYVLLQVPFKRDTENKGEAVDVTIWGTQDDHGPVFKLTKDLPETKTNRTYSAIVFLYPQRFLRLEDKDTLIDRPDPLNIDWIIRQVNGKNSITGTWNELISASSGKRWALTNINNHIGSYMSVSPSGRFLVYFDSKSRQHHSYDVKEQKTRIISNEHNKWELPPDFEDDRIGAPNYSGWVKGKDEIIVVGDGNDIWLLDASGLQQPVCMTHGIGKRKNLIFTMVGENQYVYSTKQQILLNVFSKETKASGFFFAQPGIKIDSNLINLQPYLYYGSFGMAFRGGGVSNFIPVKAANAPVFLVNRMTASQSPNYFTTTDFVSFNLQSDVWPEKNYNWPVSELLKWTSASGKEVHGILFKPGDFDPKKKYPAIIYYYEKDADGLHAFRKPKLMTDDISVPWFVSRGYLVLLSDIHYKTAKAGESAFDCINTGADKLETLTYVDKARIGIEGHSFGGYETNFILSQTGRFAAAVSAAGISDVVGFYGDYLPGFRLSLQGMVELQQWRMAGASLWERKDDYLRNSPILNADKITTPVLIMHNFKDGNVPFREASALFTALRRLNRKAWLIQYDKSGHVINNEAESLDYTMRVTQFFDHYLKGVPMPVWMQSTGEPQMKRFLK